MLSTISIHRRTNSAHPHTAVRSSHIMRSPTTRLLYAGSSGRIANCSRTSPSMSNHTHTRRLARPPAYPLAVRTGSSATHDYFAPPRAYTVPRTSNRYDARRTRTEDERSTRDEVCSSAKTAVHTHCTCAYGTLYSTLATACVVLGWTTAG